MDRDGLQVDGKALALRYRANGYKEQMGNEENRSPFGESTVATAVVNLKSCLL